MLRASLISLQVSKDYSRSLVTTSSQNLTSTSGDWGDSIVTSSSALANWGNSVYSSSQISSSDFGDNFASYREQSSQQISQQTSTSSSTSSSSSSRIYRMEKRSSSTASSKSYHKQS